MKNRSFSPYNSVLAFVVGTLFLSCGNSRNKTEENVTDTVFADTTEVAIAIFVQPKKDLAISPQILNVPADRDLRFEIEYPVFDTLGFDLQPKLRVQWRQIWPDYDTDWYDLKDCRTEEIDECDFFIAKRSGQNFVQDTIAVRMSRIFLLDPKLEAKWKFRFRLEKNGKLSGWQELPEIHLVEKERAGVPLTPKVKIIR